MSEGSRKFPEGIPTTSVNVVGNFPQPGLLTLFIAPGLPGVVMSPEGAENVMECIRATVDGMAGIGDPTRAAVLREGEPAESFDMSTPEGVRGYLTRMQQGVKEYYDGMEKAGHIAAKPKPELAGHDANHADPRKSYRGRVFFLAHTYSIFTSFLAQHGIERDSRTIWIAPNEGFTRIQGYYGSTVNRFVVIGQPFPWMTHWIKRMNEQAFGEMTPTEVIQLLKD